MVDNRATSDLAEVRRRFVQSVSYFVGSFAVMNIFVAVAKGMGGLGPVTFLLSIGILVVAVVSWIWFTK